MCLHLCVQEVQTVRQSATVQAKRREGRDVKALLWKEQGGKASETNISEFENHISTYGPTYVH